MTHEQAIEIDYYTDVLCVWAWIAQIRLVELYEQWGDRVILNHRYIDIFGDTADKIPAKWGIQDGYQKFRDHVVHSAKPFEQAPVNTEIWAEVRPVTSMNAHLVLRAVGEVSGNAAMAMFSGVIRKAFFVDAHDIGSLDVLLDLANEAGFSTQDIEGQLRSGQATASLSTDLRTAAAAGIKGSPTWVLNGGRQVLSGNVGYRILSANIEELLHGGINQASWC